MEIFIQGISIAVMAAAFLLIIRHMLPNAGVNLPKRIDKSSDFLRHTPSRRESLSVFLYALLFRVFIIAAVFVIFCIFREDGNAMPFGKLSPMWEKWDATNYMRMAHGYTYHTENGDYTTLVFFPLYSWMLRIISLALRNEVLSGIVVSALCSSVGCVFMYKLACMDYNRSAAQKAVILMCVFPFAFFYSGIMSESAFFMTSVITLYYIRRHNWLYAGIAGMFCSLSRSAGVFLIFPATVEFIEEYKLFENIKDIKPKLLLILKKWSLLLLIPLGTCIYLFINYKITGDAFYFLKMEAKYWGQTSQPFFKTVRTLWGVSTGSQYSVGTRMSAFIPGTVMLFSMYAILLLSIPKQKSMYSAWLWIYLIVNTTMTWPLSLCRYLTCAAPVYLYLGDVCDKNKKLDAAFVIGFSILFGIYLTGYIAERQIM